MKLGRLTQIDPEAYRTVSEQNPTEVSIDSGRSALANAAAIPVKLMDLKVGGAARDFVDFLGHGLAWGTGQALPSEYSITYPGMIDGAQRSLESLGYDIVDMAQSVMTELQKAGKAAFPPGGAVVSGVKQLVGKSPDSPSASTPKASSTPAGD